jgi:hypothetical protein
MVLPGDEDTLASDRLPRSVFIRELFPTFDLPDKAICGLGSLGNCFDEPTVRDILALLTLSFINIILYCF